MNETFSLLLQQAPPSNYTGLISLVLLAGLIYLVYHLLHRRLQQKRREMTTGASKMIELLSDEEIVADLRRGVLQQLTDDLFLKNTLLLTNKRLALVQNRLGSFAKRYIFLSDVQGLASERGFNLWLAVPGFMLLLAAILWLMGVLPGEVVWNISDMTHRPMYFNERLPFTLVLGVIGGVLVFLSLRYRIRVSTTSDNIFFTLDRGFGMERADRFINSVQAQADKLKSRSARA